MTVTVSSSNIENPGTVDHLFGITAHEVAHNWWPGMMLSAVAEGNILLDETIAQHVRNMCLKAEYGVTAVREHLKKEMADYLRLRSRDLIGERPLMKSYYNYYMTYAKSSLVMYTLQDYIGEERANLALRNLLHTNMYKETGQITSLDFIKEKITTGVAVVWIFGIVHIQHGLEMTDIKTEQPVIFKIKIQDLFFRGAGFEQLGYFLVTKPGLTGTAHADHHICLSL